MITGKLKNIIYSKKIRTTLDNQGSPVDKTSGKIGLIIDAENFNSKEKLIDLYKLIGIEKENFKIVVFGAADKFPEKLEADFLLKKEVSITGEFIAESIRNFTKEKFNFLICHFSENNKIGCLLAAETSASVKIGNSPDEYGIYDVEVRTDDLEIFQQEVLKYLKILKKDN